MVGGRVIRCRFPGADLRPCAGCPPSPGSRPRLDELTIHSTEPDVSLRALLRSEPAASDIEVVGSRLEDAFLILTGARRRWRWRHDRRGNEDAGHGIGSAAR